VLATALFAVGLWGALRLLGQPIPISWCLNWGDLAPTDAIAVEGLLKRARLPKRDCGQLLPEELV
jgi:CPA1 family monovalent cation:H+ antiporter